MATRAIRTVSTPVLGSVDPATQQMIGEVPVTPVDEIPSIVAQARVARKGWGRLTLQQRATAIAPAKAGWAATLSDLALLVTREMGKPLKDATGEVQSVIDGLDRKLGEIVKALQPETVEDASTRSVIYRDPFGVCAVIAPWNFPFSEPLEMVIPALMAGNAVILKPSEETPLVAQALANILNKSLPTHVLQVVHGADEQGKALVMAPGVDLVAFTGSRAAGKHILAAASATLKRVVLELGGKDPMIVLDDADLDAAARMAVHNSFRNSGQVCVSTERVYVDNKIADEFEKRVAQFASELKVGPGTQPGIDIGPMVNHEEKERVVARIARAKEQGARIVLDGSPAQNDNGNFLKPTVLADVNHDMDIMREETFGPVACIARFDDLEEAIRLANDTPYGLGAIVFGRNEERAASVARQLEAGMIGINKRCGGASGTPWVGAKQSGYGWHSGRDGHRNFAQVRVVSIPKKK